MLQEIRKMRFEEVYFGWSESRLRGGPVFHKHEGESENRLIFLAERDRFTLNQSRMRMMRAIETTARVGKIFKARE
jgi:hypothetical protein